MSRDKGEAYAGHLTMESYTLAYSKNSVTVKIIITIIIMVIYTLLYGHKVINL